MEPTWIQLETMAGEPLGDLFSVRLDASTTASELQTAVKQEFPGSSLPGIAPTVLTVSANKAAVSALPLVAIELIASLGSASDPLIIQTPSARPPYFLSSPVITRAPTARPPAFPSLKRLDNVDMLTDECGAVTAGGPQVDIVWEPKFEKVDSSKRSGSDESDELDDGSESSARAAAAAARRLALPRRPTGGAARQRCVRAIDAGERRERPRRHERQQRSDHEATGENKAIEEEQTNEERAKLTAEMKRLEAQVEELRALAGMPSRESLVALDVKQQQTRALEHAWRMETLTMCGVQSVVGSHLRAQHMSPLHTHMRLGKDLDDRKKTLESVRREKLDIGYRYLEERFRDVDDREPFCELQQWTTAQGDFCFRRADILIFEGAESIKQVFDALLFFFINMEISISEQLGQLTLRDDIDAVDTRIVNHRITTSTDYGLDMEMNAVGFSEYYEKDGQEVALLVTDTVDEDELNPYATSERVRKDISGAITMKAFRRPRSDGDTEDHLVVAMKRCVFLSILKPQFPISKAAQEDLRRNIAIWGEVMETTMKQYLRL